MIYTGDTFILLPFLCSARKFVIFCSKEFTDSFILEIVLSALRIYALSDGKHIVAGLVLALNLVPFATNMVRNSPYDHEILIA